jgi:hypothetical protein
MWLQRVEFSRQQHRANGHGRGFGDERSQHRSHEQDGQPPGRGSFSTEPRQLLQQTFGETQDGAGRGNGHHHDDENRLRETQLVMKVASGRGGTDEQTHRND